MTHLQRVHIVIVQPGGYVRSLNFIDQARYLRYHLRRLGVHVTIGKNRLREDAVNIILGAHLGFPADWKKRHTCVIFNLEQFHHGASVNEQYLTLLRDSAVIDHDSDNAAAYCRNPTEVSVVPFLHAPYLAPTDTPPLEQRPLDLLFLGELNDRCRGVIQRIESSGATVSFFDQPVFGEERDEFIRQAKSVLIISHDRESHFDQMLASQCLSLGTPVIAERHSGSRPPSAYEYAVFWFQEDSIEQHFQARFHSENWHDEACHRLARFSTEDPIDYFVELMAYLSTYREHDLTRVESGPWRPTRMNFGSGKNYMPGWLNIDVVERVLPDVLLDLSKPVSLPLKLDTLNGGKVELTAEGLDRIYANNVLEHVPDLPTLMTNALLLLRDGGEFEIEVPHERSLGAWQDPTHVRAMNENSWLYYTVWFWYLGWFEHRFDLVASTWLDSEVRECEPSQAAAMRVVLRKRATTPLERTHARLMRADFGGIAEDLVVDSELNGQVQEAWIESVG